MRKCYICGAELEEEDVEYVTAPCLDHGKPMCRMFCENKEQVFDKKKMRETIRSLRKLRKITPVKSFLGKMRTR